MTGLLILASIGCVPAWPEVQPELETARVAFVYPGSIDDYGWTRTHDDGRLYLEDTLGVETTYKDLVPTADLPAAIDALIDEGWNTIVTPSSDYVTGTIQAAVDHPDTYFLSCCTGATAANLTSYYGRMYQPIYLAGYAAGLMTNTDRLGVMASKQTPQLVRHINAFTLGARAANPDVVVDVRWLHTYFDLELETTATQELLDAGADVILGQTNTTLPLEAARDATAAHPGSPVYSVGYNNINACDVDNDSASCLTSAYWNWGPLYAEKVLSLTDGSWDPQDTTWRGMTVESDSLIGLAPLSAFVPGAIRGEVGAAESAMIDGSAQAPFVGPLKDAAGAARVPSGAAMSDEELDRICWHVEGVVDSSSGVDEPATVSTTECVGDF